MSAPLTDEEEKQYTAIIDAILTTADLATISRKKVRQGLEQALGGKDLSEKKVAIKALIEARFDAISSQQIAETIEGNGETNDADANGDAAPEEEDVNGGTNGTGYHHETDHDHNHDEDADADADSKTPEDAAAEDTSPPPKKKAKREPSLEDEDARLARELQAQENSLARSRKTRGGGTVSKPVKQKKATKKKAKSEKRVREDDDSGDPDGSDGSGARKKRKAGGGFQKEFDLSYALAELVGAPRLSRPQVVKKLWEHIKGNELQDPKDKRQIICDDKMQAVFKQGRVDMFQMNKLLGNQLYPIEE